MLVVGSDCVVPSGVILMARTYWYIYFKYMSSFMSFNMQFMYDCPWNFLLIAVNIAGYLVCTRT